MTRGKYLLELNQQRHEGAPDSVVTPFLDWGTLELDSDRLRRDPASIRAVFFAGGTDVSPQLYGEQAGRHTVEIDPARDAAEQEIFRWALAANIPMVGICRGAQFLCVMAGGTLCQHLEGHVLGRHETHAMRAIETDGRTIELSCSSTHHQMHLPPAGAEILAWAEPRLAQGAYFDGLDQRITPALEYEGVYYPTLRAIGMQWHPEWMEPTHPCVEYSVRIAEQRLFGR